MEIDIQRLNEIANEVRKDTLELIYKAGSGHPAGALSTADVFTALYFAILNHDPKNPDFEDRDRLIVSNGHVCPSLYAVMARVGYFERELLSTYSKLNSPLQGHPERERLKGIETSSGPLGSGLAQASGIAYAARMDQKKFRTFVVTSDGEHDEGNHWEAVMFAAKNNLSNLTMIIDRNGIQIDGFTEEVLPLESLADKYKAFNWSVIEVDGHNIEEIVDAANKAKAISENPTVIIAHTIPGKGVDFMEWDNSWHSKSLNKDEINIALKELKSMKGKIIDHD